MTDKKRKKKKGERVKIKVFYSIDDCDGHGRTWW